MVDNAATDSHGDPSTASTSNDHTIAYDGVVPNVTINQASGQTDPTSQPPIRFTATFSEAVTGFTSSDVTVRDTAADSLAVSVSASSDREDLHGERLGYERQR